MRWPGTGPIRNEIFVGNDSGLWRSTDAIGETGQVCASTDASHFQNLNGTLGPLAEVVSMSLASSTPDTVMAGLGVNGTTGVKGNTQPPADWPVVLGGEGGPVAIDPNSSNSAWYVNNQAGVSIYACEQFGACTPSAFGSSPVIDDADVNGDGLTMTAPAPFLVDPVDDTQLLIGTCRVWRGPANGIGWSAGNAISPILDGATGVSCDGDALIRSMAAMALPGGGEAIYVGMYSSANGGANLPGHVLSATVNAGGASPVWQDLTFNPVRNDSVAMNAYGYDISSIVIDTHDTTGNTVYATVEGFSNTTETVRTVYRSTDGGAHWFQLNANLPWTPANGLAIDTQDACTVYLATDAGVYSTRQIGSCASSAGLCWSAYGAGLPEAPAVELSAPPAGSSIQVLTAATYGRGIWQAPLWTAGTHLATATASPGALTFVGKTTKPATLTNTGNIALTVTGIAVSGNFSETDNCQSGPLQPGASCTIQVTFTPTQTSTQTGQMTIGGNVSCGQIVVALSGTGIAPGAVSLSPSTVPFGQVEVGTTSAAQQVTASNTGGTAISITGVQASAPFAIASNACGASLAAGAACQVKVEFAPTQKGAVTGTLTFTDEAGTQSAQLTGTGAAAPTDTLSATSLSFPATVVTQQSAPLTIGLTNSGDLPLTTIGTSVTGSFQASSNCGSTLPGHSSCAISVIFTPIQLGSQSGTMIVSDAERQQTVLLSGTGVTAPAIGVSPSTLNFTAQKVGVTTAPLRLTVSNTGGAPMANVGFQIGGQSASSFATGTTNCGATLKNGSSCTLLLTFTPATPGGSAATLEVSSSSFGVTPVDVPLIGTVLAPAGLGVSPLQLTFPIVQTGQPSTAQTVTVTDTGGVTIASLKLSVTSPFSLTQNTCTGSLTAGKNCTTGVIFKPAIIGPSTGALTVSSTSVAAPVTVALSGTGGTPPAIQLQPQTLIFPTTGVHAASSPLPLTVTNPGTVAGLSGLALKVTQGFKLVNNACGATLGPLASCTTGVVFAPASPGMQSGSLTVTTSTVPAGASVPLSNSASLAGVGFDFAVTSGTTPSQTVANGQTARYPLTITLLNNSPGGVFTFRCGPLPPYTQCVFKPASDPVTAGTTGSTLLQVETGLAQSSSRATGPAVWRMVPLACGLVLLPLAWRRRRKTWLLAALMAILAGAVTSCAASGGGTGRIPISGPGITPPGTYSITVTVLSNGVQHTVTPTLSLTVD